jgi:glycosyltransferase involved in cell wall biosynthesis
LRDYGEPLVLYNRHIVFITPALAGGGIEKSTPILIESIAQLITAPMMWIGINESEFHGELPHVTVVSVRRRSRDGLIKTFRALLRIRNHIRVIENPLVIVNGEVAEMFAALFAWKWKIICVEHASLPWVKKRILGRIVRLVLSRRSVRWVTVNSRQERIWPSITSFNCIPNPVFPSEPNPADSGMGLVYIGRLTEGKNVELVCQASIKAQFRLDIFGDGELSGQLQRRFEGRGDIHFHGFVEDVWSSIGANRVFVSSSLHEGDGRSIAEAIIRNQPLMLLDTPDHRRFGLLEENYFVSLEDLARKLLMNRPECFKGIRPSESVSKREQLFRDPTRVASMWGQLIHADK